MAAQCFAARPAVHRGGHSGVWGVPGLHDDHGRHPLATSGASSPRACPSASTRCATSWQIASRRPSTGRWQIVVIEDADRLTEGAANALLKGRGGAAAVDSVPVVRAVGGSRGHRDHPAVAMPARGAGDAAHRGRSRRCSSTTTACPPRRRSGRRRSAVVTSGGPGGWPPTPTPGIVVPGRWGWRVTLPPPSRAYAAAEELVATAEAEAKALNVGRDEGRIRGAAHTHWVPAAPARAPRVRCVVPPALSRTSSDGRSPRQTRASRDALDRALIDLATYFRDALLVANGAGAVTPNHPDMAEKVAALAAHASPERLLRCIEAVLECREGAGHQRQAQVRGSMHWWRPWVRHCVRTCRLTARPGRKLFAQALTVGPRHLSSVGRAIHS